MLRRTVTTLQADNVPLQIEHLTPRARGGSNRASNLTLACEPCNQRKGTKRGRVWLSRTAGPGQAAAQDAAAVNATRWAFYERLKATGCPLKLAREAEPSGTGQSAICPKPIGSMPRA